MVSAAPTALTCFYVSLCTDFVTFVRVLVASAGVLAPKGLRSAAFRSIRWRVVAVVGTYQTGDHLLARKLAPRSPAPFSLLILPSAPPPPPQCSRAAPTAKLAPMTPNPANRSGSSTPTATSTASPACVWWTRSCTPATTTASCASGRLTSREWRSRAGRDVSGGSRAGRDVSGGSRAGRDVSGQSRGVT